MNEYSNPFFDTKLINTGAGAAAGIQPNQGYSPGQFSSVQGAISGYAAGGAYGALAGAITGPVSQVLQSHKNLNNLDTNVGGMHTDAYGRPVYSVGEFTNALNQLPELEKTANWDSTNILGLGRKAGQKRDELVAGVQRGQQNYNQAESNFRNRNLQMMDYFERVNNNNYANLYKY